MPLLLSATHDKAVKQGPWTRILPSTRTPSHHRELRPKFPTERAGDATVMVRREDLPKEPRSTAVCAVFVRLPSADSYGSYANNGGAIVGICVAFVLAARGGEYQQAPYPATSPKPISVISDINTSLCAWDETGQTVGASTVYQHAARVIAAPRTPSLTAVIAQFPRRANAHAHPLPVRIPKHTNRILAPGGQMLRD